MNNQVFEPTIFHWMLAVAPIALILALAVFSMWKDVRDSFRARTSFLDDATFSDIAEAKEGGLVAIMGRVVDGGATFQAPLTGRPCVYYSAEVLVASSVGSGSGRGAGSASLKTLVSKLERLDIEVRDESGAACVRAGAEAIVFVLRERRVMFAAGTDKNRERAFLAAHGVPLPQTWLQRWVERSRGFDESILIPGDFVIVGGIARWEETPQGGGGPARRLRIEAPSDGRVTINADTDSIVHAVRERQKRDGLKARL